MPVDHAIDPRGEVILIVPGIENAKDPAALDDGLEPDTVEQSPATSVIETKQRKDIRIQVSAKHLMRGSSYFDKLLNGNWKEGREFKQNGTIEITVESWDIDAFLVVLHIIHGDLSKVPRALNLGKLGNVAIIADYYDVLEVRFFADRWIGSLDAVPHPESRCSYNIVSWLWVSFFFRDAELFHTCTFVAMNESEDEIDSCGYPIPATIIGDMNDTRTRAIQRILDVFRSRENDILQLIKANEPDLGADYNLQHTSMKLGCVSRHLDNLGLLSPTAASTFSGVKYGSFRHIHGLETTGWVAPCDCRDKGNTFEDNSCIHSGLGVAFRFFYKRIHGLQLSRYVT